LRRRPRLIWRASGSSGWPRALACAPVAAISDVSGEVSVDTGYLGGGRRRDAAEMGFIHSASPVPLGTDAGLVWRRTHLLDALLLPGLDVTGSRGRREGDVLRGHLRRGRHGVLLVPVHPRWGRLRHSSSDAGHEMGREGRGHRPGACRAGVRSRFRRRSSSAKRRGGPVRSSAPPRPCARKWSVRSSRA